MHNAVGSPPRQRRAPSSVPSAGTGLCTGHHGELLQGSFAHAERGLITLPVQEISSMASFTPTTGDRALTVVPRQRAKARDAALQALAALGRADLGGVLEIRSTIPVGKGFGSSSCDIVATIRAVHDALGRELTPELTAAIASRVESASDPLMYNGSTVLFAQREGRVVRTLPCLPPLWVLGCDSAPPDGRVLTELMALPAYTGEELRTFEGLLRDMVRALERRDVDLIGEVATQSAVINSRYLPNPLLGPAQEVSGACAAAGVQVAHSGTLVGLLFADAPDVRGRAAEAARLLRPFGARRFRLHRVR